LVTALVKAMEIVIERLMYEERKLIVGCQRKGKTKSGTKMP